MQNLSDIAVFVRVVDHGSFTDAAEELDLSRSVVSKYVTRLEERLGARLLNRTTRRLSLTEAGQAFYNQSKKGLQDIEAAEEAVSLLQESPRGTLQINSPMSFGILHIAPSIPGFVERYPDLKIDMRLEDRQVDLIEEGFDVSIRIAKLPDSSMVARRLGPCRHVLCASPDYLAKHGTPTHPDDLQAHRKLIYRYQDSPSEWRLTGPDGAYFAIPVSGAISMNNSLALQAAVVRGAGITLTPSFVVGEDIKAGRLVALMEDYQLLELSIFAIYPQRRFLSPKVRAFIDHMSTHLSDPPYWD